MSERSTKQCPACAEEILVAARKCKHCGEWLEEKDAAAAGLEAGSDLGDPSIEAVDAEILYKQAYESHYRDLDSETAAELYTKVIDQFPDSAESGYAKTQLENLERAQATFARPVGKDVAANASRNAEEDPEAEPRSSMEKQQEAREVHGVDRKSGEAAGHSRQTSDALSSSAPVYAGALILVVTVVALCINYYRPATATFSVIFLASLALVASRTTHVRVLRLFGKSLCSKQDRYWLFGIAVGSAVFMTIGAGSWVSAVQKEARENAAELSKNAELIAQVDRLLDQAPSNDVIRRASSLLTEVTDHPETLAARRRAQSALASASEQWFLAEGKRLLANKEWSKAVEALGRLPKDRPYGDSVAAAAEEARRRTILRRIRVTASHLATAEAGRPEMFAVLRKAIGEARDFGVEPDRASELRDAIEPVAEALKSLEDFDRERARPPTLPGKPDYEKPERNGIGMVWHLSGTYRGSFDGGGIVLTRGSQYFVVRDAEPPSTSYVSGYVTTVDFTELAIGGGRLATVVELSDRQAFRESQREYNREVRSAKAAHKEAMDEYLKAKRTLKQRQREYERRVESRRDLVQALQKAIDECKEKLDRTTEPAVEPLMLDDLPAQPRDDAR
jgi:hypothetical protein